MAAYVEDTIAAIATAPGPGAISILRVSGREARAVAARILRAGAGRAVPLELADSHRARTARLVRAPDGDPIDDVLVVPMLEPRSYTGEDTIEIHCHGGRVIADLALRAALTAGARSARPGEFTERAFLNGRLDLCQAEAVADMIAANSEAGLEAARRQLDGELSRKVASERDRILDTRALVEAHLDFPEDDLPPGVEAELQADIQGVQGELRALAETFARGRLVRDGLRVVLIGKPNVGKSSLLNALLGRDRALVSAEPGTTRDYLEEPLAIGPLQVLLCDTAGIREAEGDVERAGVERSAERLAEADVVVLVLDGSRALEPADQALYGRIGTTPVVAVRNKSDLTPVWERPDGGWGGLSFLSVSATTGEGVAELTAAVERAAPEMEGRQDGVLVTNARHYERLERATTALEEAADLLRGEEGELDLVAAALQLACSALDDLVGRTDNEDVLDRVFSRFCLGK
ncbi:MAG: tRNA uridine-5-carboxymethylaminomethyl(34) synthesis GTPase MnmE [Candidatus Binatia bacterium]|nr:tRNA uridine-5-carboxymethylaminomethyl(34) synthesis GTPase MnmE [Candidatus Binatia bacterium]